MSLNQLIQEGLDLMEGLAAIPFQAAQEVWQDNSSTTSRLIHRSANISEGLATLPFKVAREFIGSSRQQS